MPTTLSLLFLVVLLAGCVGSGDPPPPPLPPTLTFEAITPAVEGGDPRVLFEVEAMGDSVYISYAIAGGYFVSFDRRKTWKILNFPVPIEDLVFVNPKTAVVYSSQHKLSFINLETGQINHLVNEPKWTYWGIRGNTLFAVEIKVDEGQRQVGDETQQVWLHRSTDFASASSETWTTTKLPDLPPPTRRLSGSLYFGDQGQIYVASGFGLQVSADDGQTWTQLPTGGHQGKIFVTREGTIFISTTNTLKISRDGGKTYADGNLLPGDSDNQAQMEFMYQAEDDNLYFPDIPYRSTDQGLSYELAFDLSSHTEQMDRLGIDRVLFKGGEFYLNLKANNFSASNFVSANPTQSLTYLNTPAVVNLTYPLFGVAYPLSNGRYVALWNHSVAFFTPGDSGWKLGQMFTQVTLFHRLLDERLVLATLEGLRFSSDEGQTWSKPVPVSLKATNSVIVHGMAESGGKILLNGEEKGECNVRPLMESSDGGQTWQVIKDMLFNVPPGSSYNPNYAYPVDLKITDKNGVIFAKTRIYSRRANAISNNICDPIDQFAARSTNQGITWTGISSRLPYRVNSQNDLVSWDFKSGQFEIKLFKASQSAWVTLGIPKAQGISDSSFFIGSDPYLHLDSQDHALITDGFRLMRSTTAWR